MIAFTRGGGAPDMMKISYCISATSVARSPHGLPEVKTYLN